MTASPEPNDEASRRRYRVTHRTSYQYGAPLTVGHHVAHLLPRATPTQQVHEATLELSPPPDHRIDHLDLFGNITTYLLVPGPADSLVVTSRSEVTVFPPPSWAGEGQAPAWERVAAALPQLHSADAIEARQLALDSPLVEPSLELADYAAAAFAPGRPLDEAAVALTGQIYADFAFDPSFSDVSTPLADVLDARRGVCQDFAHLMIGCLRSLGLAARYVSGYIETNPPPGRPRLVGADASHAWCSVWIPGRGWLDCDPTNDHAPPQRHVTVAWGRDYGDVSPVRGIVYGPATSQELDVGVDVERVL